MSYEGISVIKTSAGHVVLAMTGASGSAYGLLLLKTLLQSGCQVSLMVSTPGRMVIQSECGLALPSRTTEITRQLEKHLECDTSNLKVYGREDWSAPVASGSNAPDAMVVCPCTTGTLASIASGLSRTLIERAADVVIKETRTLILVVRETPFSLIHIDNMKKLALAGVVIMPANPGFYHQPETIEDLVRYMVARIMDHLNIEHTLFPRWGADL